jgi:glycosyltransferase involved in cell wall biosynthesis
MPPTVSLIIPTYNRGAHFRVALQSALQQTHRPLEIVIVDDGSTDATPDVVEALADDRVRYLRQPTNQGPNANWRAGMQAATGAVFGFLADDDRLHPEYVERLATPLFEDDRLAFSFCDHWVIDADGRRDSATTDATAHRYGRAALTEGRLKDIYQPLLIDESVYIGAVLFRSEHVPPSYLQPAARSAMGGWILYRCARSGRPGYYVDDRLMECRWEDGSVSRSPRWLDAMTEGNINRLRQMLDDAALDGFHPPLRKQLASHLATRAHLHLIQGHRRQACTQARESFRLRPTFRAATTYLLTLGGRVGTVVAQKIRGVS